MVGDSQYDIEAGNRAGVKTVVLFFEKGSSSKKIWYYQLNLNRNLGKTNPLNEKDLEEFVNLQKDKKSSPNSWTIDIKDVDQKTFDLSVKNLNKQNVADIRSPEEILEEIKDIDNQVVTYLKSISSLLKP